jgi:ParB-like chromosome segregation protein Spo0J
VPVIVLDHLTETQKRAFILADNRLTENAGWDEDALSLELQQLSEADFDLDLTGFAPEEIDALLAIPDEERANAVPPVPENPIYRICDIWLCGNHRVPCGDAAKS